MRQGLFLLPLYDLIGQFDAQPFIGVDAQYPVILSLIRSKILLLGIAFLGTGADTGSFRYCEFACLVRASGVHDNDLITTRETCKTFHNAVLFIKCDDCRRDWRHGRSPCSHAITDRMRNLKLTIAYDGTDFHGWQIQPNLRTIQGELEGAFRKLFNHDVNIFGSGRTDAGVHAHRQVANVHTIRTMDCSAVLWGTNALLPREIRILSVEDVDPEFHARLSARSKIYEYHLWRGTVVSPFRCRYVYACRYLLDGDEMDRATAAFLGTHDFTSFCATATEVEDRTRTIYEAGWSRSQEEWVFRIRGNGFLQYM